MLALAAQNKPLVEKILKKMFTPPPGVSKEEAWGIPSDAAR